MAKFLSIFICALFFFVTIESVEHNHEHTELEKNQCTLCLFATKELQLEPELLTELIQNLEFLGFVINNFSYQSEFISFINYQSLKLRGPPFKF